MKRFGAILAAVVALAAACGGGNDDAGNGTGESGSGDGGNGVSAEQLSGREMLEVSAVEAVETDGFTVESAVCEVVSPENYRPDDNVFGGKLVFHAFRVSGPRVTDEPVVLFASNHAAADGAGLTFPVNDAAIRLDQGFPPGSEVADPITLDTPGAPAAVECAEGAEEPPAVDAGEGDFDVEAWRDEAIERFGAEEVFDDGSREDYVKIAFSICDQSESERDQMRENLGGDYEGSFQRFIIEEFCPNV